MLFSTNGGTAQTFTNELLLGTAPVTSGVTYAVIEPAGYTGPITLDSAAGTVGFGREVYDKVTRSRTPERVTVQATHQGKTASYTFTVTDHFSPRDGHTSVVLNNAIYVIGGLTRNASLAVSPLYDNEVWRSADGGATWDRLTSSSPAKRFSPRFRHASTVRGGDIYVIAGRISSTYYNDVWKSPDGVDWTQAAGAASGRFPARRDHGSAVLGTDIYVVSGVRTVTAPGSSANVWRSDTGGTSWNKLSLSVRTGDDAGVLGRNSFGLEVLNNVLYLLGGEAPTDSGGNEVWKSSDGAVWSHETKDTVNSAKFTPRHEHSSAVLNGALYVIGGEDTTIGSTVVRNDIWKSADAGKTWLSVGVNADALERVRHTSAVLDGALYVIGGSKGSTLQNDVWKSADGGVTWQNVHKNP